MLPAYFKKVNVIDVGSKDINGTNKGLFSRCHYIGIDLSEGKNVDVVGPAHIVLPSLLPKLNSYVTWSDKHKRIQDGDRFETIISTECLEHDRYLVQTLEEMYKKLKAGGLLIISCGGDGRWVHGTSDSHPELSPDTTDYYMNISNRIFSGILPPSLFDVYHLAQVDHDLQFYGLKNS